MTMVRYCDGITRRDFLRVGMLGTGLSLAGYLRLAHAGELRGARARSAVFVFLAGGPSHLDTFDLKPDAPAEIRGEFKPIPTNVGCSLFYVTDYAAFSLSEPLCASGVRTWTSLALPALSLSAQFGQVGA